MTNGFLIHLRKICNWIQVLVLLFVFAPAHAALESNEEFDIAYALLNKFSQKCSYIINEDTRRISEIKINLDRSIEDKHFQAQKCMEEELSQIEGTRIVFRNLCTNVTGLSRDLPVDEVERLVVDTRYYTSGIRPYVQRMNDCLRVSSKGDRYLVNVVGVKLENRGILDRLNFRNIKPVFRPNRTDFR